MKISTILDHIDSGYYALPEFQRGYVWNRDQVRGFFDSLYKRHPVGGLLVWITASRTASYRGDSDLPDGVVNLLLDGQQRMTSLYGVARGKPPSFFDGNADAFTGLYFHLSREVFEFYQPIKMKDDPYWIDVSNLMINGQDGLEALVENLAENPDVGPRAVKFTGRISRILGIFEIELHTQEVTGKDKTVDVVVDIFNRVNTGGTKLSKGDLALAKICAEWPDGRNAMKSELEEWTKAGYNFSLDWLLRSMNTVLTGEAKFLHLHDKSSDDIQRALHQASKHIDTCLNLISGRLGLDHDQVFFGRYAIPVLAYYLEQRENLKKGPPSKLESDTMLFWYVQAAMWGRFSGSTESTIDKDLESLKENNLDCLLEELRLWHGVLRAEPSHFTGWSLGARFYPVLYMLTRMAGAKDWGTGLPLKADLLGKLNRLEVHHIFPKSRLYKATEFGFSKSEVNAVANYCFLTKDSNLKIGDQLPENYFPKVENEHPGVLASQWIPDDPNLWKIQNFRQFLEARKSLLANELNSVMEELLHGDKNWLEGEVQLSTDLNVIETINGTETENELERLNNWVADNGLPKGELDYDHVNEESGEQMAVFDLAWPKGLQENFSQPVTLLIDEEASIVASASQAGYKCFTNVEEFRHYVQREVLAESAIN